MGFLAIWLIRRGIPLERIRALKPPLILLLLALSISIIFSIDKTNSLRELYKYINGVLIFLTAVSLNHKERLQVAKTIILAGFLISLLAIYQYFFGFRHLLDYLARNKTSPAFALDYIQCKRVYLPFVSPNTLGGYLAMIIPLILAFRDRKKKILLNPFLLFLISALFALLLTKSLGASLSIFLGLIIYFYLQGNLDKKRGLLIAGLLMIIALIFLLRQTAARRHILPTFSLFMRLNYWEDTLRIIKSSPWTGLGPGNFNLAFSRYAHNSYLQIWAEMGISGIISILWLIIAVFKSALKNIKDSPNKKLMIGLITANAVFLIHNLVDFSLFLPEVAFIWWVILGLSFKATTHE